MNCFHSLCFLNLIVCALCTNDDSATTTPCTGSDCQPNIPLDKKTSHADEEHKNDLSSAASADTSDSIKREDEPSSLPDCSRQREEDEHIASILKSLHDENHSALPINHENFVLERPWKFDIKDPNLDHPEKMHDAYADLIIYLQKLFRTRYYLNKADPNKKMDRIRKLIPSAQQAKQLRERLKGELAGYFVLSTAIEFGCPLNLAGQLQPDNSYAYYPECLLRYLSIIDRQAVMKVGVGMTSFVADFMGSSALLSSFMCPLLAARLNLPEEPFCTKIINLLESSNVCLQVANIQSIPEEKLWGQSYGDLFNPSLTCAKSAPRLDLDLNEPASTTNNNEAYTDGQFTQGLPDLSDSGGDCSVDKSKLSELDTALHQTWNLSQEVLEQIGNTLLYHLYNHPSHKWMTTIPLWGFILVDTDFMLRYIIDESSSYP